MRLLALVLPFFLVGPAFCMNTDFCNIRECNNVPHVGCNNDLTFRSGCKRYRQLADMTIFREYLVKIHNKYREDVASGAIWGIAKARHMPELAWSSKLALLAEYHVKRCERDISNYCVVMDSFHNPAINYGSSVIETVRYRKSMMSGNLINQIQNWWSQVYQLRADIEVENIEEITNILNDDNVYVGCAAAEDYDRSSDRFVLICYYNTRYEESRPIYERGTFAARSCANGTSEEYPHLCRYHYDEDEW